MSIQSVKITQAQFDLLNTNENWHIDEVPRENWNKIPGLQRLDDTFAIMGSGSFTDPRMLKYINNLVAGIDVLTVETHPKSGESSGNAYHYVFQLVGDIDYPYIMHGPYTYDMGVPHWFDVKDLDNYWKK